MSLIRSIVGLLFKRKSAGDVPVTSDFPAIAAASVMAYCARGWCQAPACAIRRWICDLPHTRRDSPLVLNRTSYEFHQQLESPFAFFRRQWKAIAFFGGGFALILTAVVLLVDPAFFYPRLQTDPLNYYLKAKLLVDTGSTDAAYAVNLRPFAYVSMPGVLRAPFIAAFADFDDQLRAIQLANIVMLGIVALMSAYIFSWALPVARHWMAIAFAFVFTVLSPVWMANLILPLADAPYTAFTLATVLVAIELFCSPRPLVQRPLLITTLALLFIVSFLLRFTAPVLVALLAPLALARWRHDTLSTRTKVLVALLVGVLVTLLVILNLDAIQGRYLREPLFFVKRGEKLGMLINLFGAGFPTQVIPTFQLGFVHPPIIDYTRTSFLLDARGAAWAGVGLVIGGIIIAGMWFSRRRFLPEILYLVAALPVIGLMMPSTTRYLMSYQPLFWIFFYVGAATLARRYAPWIIKLVHSKLAVAGFLFAVATVVIGLRAWKVAGSASERDLAVPVKRVPEYVAEVSDTFRSLRRFLDTLPRDRSLIVASRGAEGRWKAISDLDYYRPDSALSRTVASKEVYLLIECGTQDGCDRWDPWKQRTQARLARFGRYEYDSVFAVRSGRARAEVLRMRTMD